jgi:NAD(P) transhydrogenase subunit beta
MPGWTTRSSYKDNNRMLFGDAKKMLDEVLVALKS